MPKPTLCTIVKPGGGECNAPASDGTGLSICYRHLVMSALALSDMRTPEADRVFSVDSVRARQPDRGKRDTVVYYFRLNDEVKIGFTKDLPTRAANIRHDEILAVEPGGLRVERLRHQQFAESRTVGEWFRATPEILNHAQAARDQYGDPIENWREIGSLCRRAELHVAASDVVRLHR